VEWGQVHDPGAVADRLGAGGYDAVTLSHSETSTGALQDLEAIAEVVAEHDETLLLVDSVTGIGGVETRSDAWGIDFILTGSQKALALPPGLAFGVAGEAMLERSAKAPAKGWYFDLVDLHDQISQHQTPATPAVSLLYALDYQLKRMADETIEGRWKRHSDMQARTFEWVEDMRESGHEVNVFAAEGHRSATVSCIAIADPDRVVSELFARGWVVGGGYGKIKDTTFRIGHMGDHTLDELDKLLEVISDVMA
jgi:aspartate aminotransferase-like enzyme